MMNKKLIFLLLVVLACRRPSGDPGETTVTARVPVTVALVSAGEMSEYIYFTATSLFQEKSIVRATAGGYVEEQLVNTGDAVAKTRELFRIRTKESASLKADTANTLGFTGLIPVRASLGGMVISIDHPKGDYVQEGDQLAVISVPESLVFILDVPFESAGFIKTDASCEVILPDSSRIAGHVKSVLPSMNNAAQTQRYIIQPSAPCHQPENLIAHVRIIKQVSPKAISLPRGCILSDEVQQQFWVMKMINDSTAVKVAVSQGLRTPDRIEITAPAFAADDRFLATGNYGLGDTAKVVVQGTYKEH